MRSTLTRAIALLTILVVFAPATARADSISAGDFVVFTDRPGSPGGEFGISVYDTPGGSPIDFFVTFCLQMTEYIGFGQVFIVGSVTNYAMTEPADRGGNSAQQDEISAQTEWLYTQFRSAGYGALGALGYNGTATAANSLQNAIWFFENETSAAAGNPYIAAANAAIAGGWTGNGSVGVMNLYYHDPSRPGGIGAEAQDQLVLVPVPEPASMLTFTIGALAVGFARRRLTAAC